MTEKQTMSFICLQFTLKYAVHFKSFKQSVFIYQSDIFSINILAYVSRQFMEDFLLGLWTLIWKKKQLVLNITTRGSIFHHIPKTLKLLYYKLYITLNNNSYLSEVPISKCGLLIQTLVQSVRYLLKSLEKDRDF